MRGPEGVQRCGGEVAVVAHAGDAGPYVAGDYESEEASWGGGGFVVVSVCVA